MKRSSSAGQKVRYASTAKKDPATWSSEVIGALCRRLPGGDTSLTAPCDVCGSVFWPCLCSTNQKFVRNSRHLRAPRVVECAENRRLNKYNFSGSDLRAATSIAGPLGNLRMVRLNSSANGMNRSRMQVLGTEDVVWDGSCHNQSFRTGSVVRRTGDKYVVTLDGEDEWSQDLRLTAEEIDTLLLIVDDELTVDRNNRVVKSVSVEFHSDEEAFQELELVQFPGCFLVRDVLCDGKAWQAGLRIGHVLSQLWGPTGDFDGSYRSWTKLDHQEHLPGPFTKVSHDQLGLLHGHGFGSLITAHLHKDSSTASLHMSSSGGNLFATAGKEKHADLCAMPWPCKLVFNALPPGWKAVCEVGPAGAASEEKLTLRALSQLAREDREATIRFVHPANDVISRSEYALRHEHVWEHELHQSRQNDVELLMNWATKSHLTPAQLEFAFNSLVKQLSGELKAFESDQAEVTEVLLLKAKRQMQVQAQLQTYPPPTGESRRNLEHQLELVQREMRAIFQQVPLFFLLELSQNCRAEPDEAEGPASKEKLVASKYGKHLKAAAAEDEAGDVRANVLKMLAKSSTASVLPATPTATLTTPAALGPAMRRSATAKQLEATNKAKARANSVLGVLGEQADHALQAARQGKLRTREFLNPADPDAEEANPEDTKANSLKDGQLSIKDFTAALSHAGMTWFSKEEIKRQFEGMDKDKSGFLTLGEVLKAAQRLAELLRLFKDFQLEQEASGQSTQDKQLTMTRFTTRLLLGDDLVGPPTRKVIPDDSITVSSCHRNRPEMGMGEMFRSRLDWSQAPWTADVEDKSPWIQWTLPGLRKITAVLTRGNPVKHSRCWVTSFRVEYAEEEPGRWIKVPGNFTANTDGAHAAWVVMPEPLLASRVRLYPISWVPESQGPSLRATLMGMMND